MLTSCLSVQVMPQLSATSLAIHLSMTRILSWHARSINFLSILTSNWMSLLVIEAAAITALLSLMMTTGFRISWILVAYKKIDNEPLANSLLFLEPAMCLANIFDANSLIRVGTTTLCVSANNTKLPS